MAKKSAYKGRRMKAATVRHRQFLLRVLAGLFVAVCIAIVVFDFVMMITGGWDDISLFVCLLAPTCAMISFMVSAINVTKYRARRYIMAVPVMTIALAGVFFTIAAIGISKTSTEKYIPTSSESVISQTYRCSDSIDGALDTGIIMTKDRAWKIYNLNSLDNYVSGSYGLIEDGDETRVVVRISDNYSNGDARYETTRFALEVDEKVRFVADDFTFFCEVLELDIPQ